jgi:integrase
MARHRNKSIKTRSGVSIRERNGRLFVAVRMKGFPSRYLSFPKGTSTEEAMEKGLEVARKLKLRDVPTLAHKVLSELTTRRLIVDYLRQCHLSSLAAKFDGRQPYVHGRPLKRSHDNEKIFLDAILKREPTLCDKPLGQVTTSDFEDYRDRRLASGIKPATLRRELNPLRHIYKLARQQFKISFDPFKDLVLPKEDEGRTRTMSLEERTRILKATEECRGDKQGRLWRALVLAAVTTAARGGELLKLRWANLDFEQGTLHFPAEITKSGKSRTIPMSKYLQKNLEAYQGYVPEEQKTPTSIVFPLTHSAKEQGWRRLCRQAKPPIKGLHFHDLKHTAMTSFASSPIKLDEREIAYMGDHKEARMSSRYEHIQMIENIRARLDIGYGQDEHYSFSEVTLPDTIKFFAKANKNLKEKVAVFKVDNDYKLSSPLGVYSKEAAAKITDIWIHELVNLDGVYNGRNIFKVPDDDYKERLQKHGLRVPDQVRYFVVAYKILKQVLEELGATPVAAQRLIDSLQERRLTAVS